MIHLVFLIGILINFIDFLNNINNIMKSKIKFTLLNKILKLKLVMKKQKKVKVVDHNNNQHNQLKVNLHHFLNQQ